MFKSKGDSSPPCGDSFTGIPSPSISAFNDGARNAWKLARSVWSRGKTGDNFKRLPIATLVKKGLDINKKG